MITGAVNGVKVNIDTGSVPTNTRLSTGLSIWRGLVSEEYLSSLKPWSRAVKVFQEMQDDVVIGALFESIKTPLLASPFEITAAGDTPEDIEAQEFLSKNLIDNPNFEWTQHVEESLEFMDMGFAITEKVLEKQPDGKLHLKSLMPIGQESLHQWAGPDELGNMTGFIQRDTVTGVISSAPMDKLLHFVFRGRKKDPQGRGILRSLYRPWYFKKNLEAIEAIGAERDVGNAPVAKLKEGVRYSDADLADLRAALEGFRMDEAVYVILPGGVELEAYGGGSKVYDIRSMIRDWQHLIRQRFFADFLSFGSESVGTQALAREMTTFFGMALRSIQEMMLSVWNRQLIPWLFKWNNWELDVLPRIDWLRPGDTNVQAMAQALSTLIGANLLTPEDTELRARIRTQLGLRKLEGPLAMPGNEGTTEPGSESVPTEGATQPKGAVQPAGSQNLAEGLRSIPVVLAWSDKPLPVWKFASLGDSLGDIVTRLIDMVGSNGITRSEALGGLQDLQERRARLGLLNVLDLNELKDQTERLIRALWPQEEADLLLGV